MTLAFLIYTMSFLGKLTTTLKFLFVLIAGLTGLLSLVCLLEQEAKTVAVFKWIKRGLIALLVAGTLNIFIPSEKTGWMIVGGYAAQTAYQSEAGEKLKKVITNKLDVILEEQLSDAQKLVDKKKPKE